MQRLFAVLALVWTLVAGAILVELYRIDQSLRFLSSPMRAFAAMTDEQALAGGIVETEAQRKARIQAVQQRMSKDLDYALSAPKPAAQSSRSSRQTAPPLDPRR